MKFGKNLSWSLMSVMLHTISIVWHTHFAYFTIVRIQCCQKLHLFVCVCVCFDFGFCRICGNNWI